jgi:acetylornithine aminotransferase
VGQKFQEMLGEVTGRHPDQIQEVRGHGLMLGVELAQSGPQVWQELLDAGFICNLTQETVLRLLPPLIIEESDLQAFARALERAIQNHSAEK